MEGRLREVFFSWFLLSEVLLATATAAAAHQLSLDSTFSAKISNPGLTFFHSSVLDFIFNRQHIIINSVINTLTTLFQTLRAKRHQNSSRVAIISLQEDFKDAPNTICISRYFHMVSGHVIGRRVCAGNASETTIPVVDDAKRR